MIEDGRVVRVVEPKVAERRGADETLAVKGKLRAFCERRKRLRRELTSKQSSHMNPLGVEAEIIAIAVQLFESIVVRVYYQP